MRRQHRLKANARQEMPTYFIFVDTEALIEQETPVLQRHTLRLGHAIFIHRRRSRSGDITITRDTCDFTTIGSFWDFVESKCKAKKKVYIFAHNWNYDAGILAMATVPAARGWECVRYVNEKPPVIIRLQHRKKGSIQILDTLNYFMGSLASLGAATGQAKGMLSGDGAERITIPLEWFKLREDELSLEQRELMWDYCQNDVEIIVRLMMDYLQFLADHDLGNFQPTLASQAMSAFKHRFAPKYESDSRLLTILIHDRARVCALERDAYHGGRTECLFIGHVSDLLYKVDVNSLYPSVMLAKSFPTKLIKDGPTISVEDVRSYLDRGYGVIAKTALDTDRPAYALVGERLTFPIDRFETALCSPEIAYALDHGHVRSFGEYAIYEMEPIFVEYVEFFYGLRLKYKREGNGSYDLMTKLMMNSLYGKFSQRGEVWENTGEESPAEGLDVYKQGHSGTPIVKERVRMGLVQRLIEEPETYNSFPAISAHVSAHARMRLWSAIETAGVPHVYYMDTDSLAVDQQGFDAMTEAGLIDPVKLGMWKLEGTTRNAHFHNVKDYQFGAERHIKGVSRNAVMVAPKVFRQAHFHSWDILQAKGVDGVIYVEERLKRMARQYKKGNVAKDGEVSPFSMGGNWTR